MNYKIFIFDFIFYDVWTRFSLYWHCCIVLFLLFIFSLKHMWVFNSKSCKSSWQNIAGNLKRTLDTHQLNIRKLLKLIIDFKNATVAQQQRVCISSRVGKHCGLNLEFTLVIAVTVSVPIGHTVTSLRSLPYLCFFPTSFRPSRYYMNRETFLRITIFTITF